MKIFRNLLINEKRKQKNQKRNLKVLHEVESPRFQRRTRIDKSDSGEHDPKTELQEKNKLAEETIRIHWRQKNNIERMIRIYRTMHLTPTRVADQEGVSVYNVLSARARLREFFKKHNVELPDELVYAQGRTKPIDGHPVLCGLSRQEAEEILLAEDPDCAKSSTLFSLALIDTLDRSQKDASERIGRTPEAIKKGRTRLKKKLSSHLARQQQLSAIREKWENLAQQLHRSQTSLAIETARDPQNYIDFFQLAYSLGNSSEARNVGIPFPGGIPYREYMQEAIIPRLEEGREMLLAGRLSPNYLAAAEMLQALRSAYIIVGNKSAAQKLIPDTIRVLRLQLGPIIDQASSLHIFNYLIALAIDQAAGQDDPCDYLAENLDAYFVDVDESIDSWTFSDNSIPQGFFMLKCMAETLHNSYHDYMRAYGQLRRRRSRNNEQDLLTELESFRRDHLRVEVYEPIKAELERPIRELINQTSSLGKVREAIDSALYILKERLQSLDSMVASYDNELRPFVDEFRMAWSRWLGV